MIDLIRESAVPAGIIQSAAKGALAIPDDEMIEILVYLASNPVFGEQARMTLAGWDEAASRDAVANPQSAPEVLQYFAAKENLRPNLIRHLIGNPSLPEQSMITLAASGPSEVVQLMLDNARASASSDILNAISSNVHVTLTQAAAIRERLWIAAGNSATDYSDPAAADKVLPEMGSGNEGPDDVLDEDLNAYLLQHAEELEAVGEQEFQPIGGIEAYVAEVEDPLAEAAAVAAAAAAGKVGKGPVIVTRGSALQKIARMGVKERIQLAFRGNKEERAILIRDGTKLVSLSVLESPKIGAGEVEKFAGQRNVSEAVLRQIPMKRQFVKNYNVVKNLLFNPRTPLDVSLTLVKNLLPHDLKALSGSKDIPDTIRKVALKMFKQKTNTSGKKSTD
jgi:hypothetical protein